MNAAKEVTLSLTEMEVGQLLDGLAALSEEWDNTARFLHTGESDEDFMPRDCRDAREANRIAEYYRMIGAKIERHLQQ